MRPIEKIRLAANSEEIDYTLIMSCLKDYAKPRNVITNLIKEGSLIRVKKGLYIFAEPYRRRFYSPEVLANLIYGPSYISLEYALDYHGMIPEAALEVTSVTSKRRKVFQTPVGNFEYIHIPEPAYSAGVMLEEVLPDVYALMATPEKALADYIYYRKHRVSNLEELKELLIDNYRIEISTLAGLDLKLMESIASRYQYSSIYLLPTIIKELR